MSPSAMPPGVDLAGRALAIRQKQSHVPRGPALNRGGAIQRQP